MAYVGALVEVYTLVTLTATEEVTGYRVSSNLCQCTRHTERTARHCDVSSAGNVRHLITAIDTRQDMAATDVHIRVALNQTSRWEPFKYSFCFCFIGEVTRATAKDITIECMTVRTCSACGTIILRIIFGITCMFIVWQPSIILSVSVSIYSIRPVSTLSHRCRLRINLRCRSSSRVYEVGLSVSCCHGSTEANLTTLYVYMRITEHTTILSATIYTTCNKRSGNIFCVTVMTSHVTVLDCYHCAVNVCPEVDILIRSRIFQFTTTGTEYVTIVIRHGHRRNRCSCYRFRITIGKWSYISTAYGDSTLTGISSKGSWFTDTAFMSCSTCMLRCSKRIYFSNITFLTATIDTVIYITVTHLYGSITGHIT